MEYLDVTSESMKPVKEANNELKRLALLVINYKNKYHELNKKFVIVLYWYNPFNKRCSH